MRLLASAILIVTAVFAVSCESPWDQPSSAALASHPVTTHQIYANDATLGKWIDKRPRSQITHGMLVIDGPKPFQHYFPPNSTVVVTTTSDTIAARADEIAGGKLGLPAGMHTNYALGTTVDVRIERIVEGGKRVLVEESRVSFLEIVQR
jgi:hypothetical protein